MSDKSISFSLKVLSLCLFAMGTASLSVVGALESIAQALQITRSHAAWLVPAFAVTFAVAAPVIQLVVGHWQRRTLLLIGLLTLAAGTLASALAPNYEVLFAARILSGLGAAAISPMAAALGAAIVEPKRQGHALAVVFSGITFASVLGVPVTSWIAAELGWRWMFALATVVTLAVALLLTLKIKDRSHAEPLRAAQLVQLLTNFHAMGGLAITLLGMSALFTTYTMITPVLGDHFGAGTGAISFALLLYGVAGLLGNRLARYVALKWTAERSVTTALLLMAFGFVVLYTAPAWFAMALLAMIPWAVALDVFFPAQQRRMVELVPEMRGLVLALNSSALFGGVAVGGYLAGAVSAGWGLMALPLVSVGLAGVGLGVLWVSVRVERVPGNVDVRVGL